MRVTVVRALRRGLPAAAGALILACIAQATFRDLTDPPLASGPVATSLMLKPSFSGSNRDGGGYVISGAEARREDKVDGLILIDKPLLKLRNARNKLTQMTSKTGVYNEKTAKLLLKGDVRVNDGAGTSFSAEQAVVDTHTGAVSGQQGVQAQNASGKLQSRDYTVLDNGDRMILKGGVHGRIVPQK
jgi:lipopolysaccharide export system protein LptC